MYQKTFGESAGLVLRKIANVLWFFLPIIIIIFTLVISLLYSNITAPPTFPDVAVEKCIICDVNYNDYSNNSTFSLKVTFNQNVYAGTATVEFYDAQNRLLESSVLKLEPESFLDDYGMTLEKSFISIDGRVASAKVKSITNIESAELDIYYADEYYDYDYSYIITSLCIVWAFLRCIYIYPLVITALFFNCKSYEINGHCIVVYSGRLHNYIKVDGRKIDEKNVLLPFKQQYLNATLETGEYIEVHIPAVTKRFTLRSNGVLQNPTKIK